MQLVGLPFFIQFECTFQDEEKLYFLTEFVGNGTLQDYIGEWGKVPVEVTKHIAARLVASIEALHSKNICHRDLKPQNILMSTSYETKLCDFGEAKVLAGLNPVAIAREFRKLIRERLKDDGESLTSSSEEAGEGDDPFEGMFEDEPQQPRQEADTSVLSGPTPRARGTFVGTALYTSPEMLLSNTSGPFSDLWALGVIIFQMLTGNVPWRGRTTPIIFDQVLNREVEFPEGMPAEAVDLIDQLMQLQPYSRIGAGREGGDYARLKAHPFFSGIDFRVIEKGGLVGPIPPPPTHAAARTEDPFAGFQIQSFQGAQQASAAKFGKEDRQGNEQHRRHALGGDVEVLEASSPSSRLRSTFGARSPERASPVEKAGGAGRDGEERFEFLRVPTLTDPDAVGGPQAAQPPSDQLDDEDLTKERNRGLSFGQAAERVGKGRRNTARFQSPRSVSPALPAPVRQAYKGQPEDEGELRAAFEKTLREEHAKNAKEEARLNQMVEHLTLQLADASERERNLKRTHQTVVDALQHRLNERTPAKQRSDEEANEEVRTLQLQIQELRRGNLQQTLEMKEQQHRLELELGVKSQELLAKDSQILELKRQVSRAEHAELARLQKEHEGLLADKESQYLERERKLNLNILSYQRDLQRQTDKLETQLQAVRASESKISELGTQI